MQRSLEACCIALAVAMASVASAQPIPVATRTAPEAPPPGAAAVPGAAAARQEWDWLWPIRGKCDADPKKNPRNAAAFFDLYDPQVLSNLDMTVWRDQGSLHTELANDTGFCVFRISLGLTMAKASPSDAIPANEREAVQRLVTSGGNVVIGGAAPLLFHRFDTADEKSWVGMFLSPRLGTDVPLLSEGSQFRGNTDLGVEAHGVYWTDKKNFSFYARARGSWLWTTRNYANDLGMLGREAWLAQGLVGVRVTNFFQLSVTFLLHAPKAVRDRYPDALVTLTANAPTAPK